MGQVIKVWEDKICSKCYAILELNSVRDPKKFDEPMFCWKCEDVMFPIVIVKREYDMRLVGGLNQQELVKPIEHGIEIIRIEGVGIITQAEKSEPKPIP